ncbi:potassium transporter Kup [Microbacterium rhizomatis]|uniref:Probable potassium transport system protein Kup n=1 Tax=Microbacterium rhizomatis TaxID=1631477 RepID=A0A5J5J9E6_9MICO|nr:KUP/HAK/KT family potassium transporter [Microbacterium rhizomatis]KAA9111423.1 potassium transporter Kup [Microbacterium rhizomatis]
MAAPGTRRFAKTLLVVGALGVVFGDIGTSPIYTIQTVFNPADPHPVPMSPDNVYGIASLIFWSVTLIVTIAYVGLILRADNEGEGGIMALLTLVGKKTLAGSRRTKSILVALGIFGASLFFGDSMITPAISVLSAVEGLRVAAPPLADFVIPITIVIIVVLFSFQRFGTAAVARLFGPVMVAWFLAIGVFGILGIAREPEILRALLPTYAIAFAVSNPSVAFFALAAVVLAITGAEALFADLGHFGRVPIARAWLILVFPTCVLSYFGQSALILNDPAAVASPFFLLIPGPLQLPMVILATAATVIASQAVITGAFSVARQAVQLGYLPRLRIEHTSARTIGQIYVPLVNWILLIAVIVLVLSFRESSALAYAFGMAVTGTIIITTTLFLYYVRESWRAPLWLVLVGGGILLTVEGLFFAANLTKITHGAWLPLAIAVVTYLILMTWYRGRQLVTIRREREEGSLAEFLDHLHDRTLPVVRVPGTAVYLNRGTQTTPLAMQSTVRHLGSLHQNVIILSIETAQTPTVPPEDRITTDALKHTDDGIILVRAKFGYMERPDVPQTLGMLDPEGLEIPIELDEASYFLSTIDLHRGKAPGLARWRKPLFIATSRGAADAAQYFDLPPDRTILMGSRVEI